MNENPVAVKWIFLFTAGEIKQSQDFKKEKFPG